MDYRYACIYLYYSYIYYIHTNTHTVTVSKLPHLTQMNIYSDLSHLPELDSDKAISSIAQVLQSRFKADQPYSQLGQHRLLVVNPLKTLELTNDITLEAYGHHGYKNLSQNETNPPEPHVYEMATRVYLLMRRRGEDQAIVLSGFSGSGKSTTHFHLLKELMFLSTHTRKENRLKNQILNINKIFESFGTVASILNESASSLGQFQTLQFNEKGRIIGCYSHIFLMNKRRVTQSTQSNYNVFYQLLEGLTPDEKQALHLTHSNFNYLKTLNNQRSRSPARDAIAFGDLKAALKLCGFKTKTVAQMCQLLAAILHLGNIQFIDGNKHSFGGSPSNLSQAAQESCRIRNKDVLTLVAASLGVATSRLETTLTHKSRVIGNEFCSAYLTVEVASEQRDDLAHTLYYILLLWIMQSLNLKFNSTSNNIRTISILDTVGFQTHSQRARSFHDLCANYASEKLTYYLVNKTFSPGSVGNSKMFQDGVWPDISLPSTPEPLSFPFFHGTNRNPHALFPVMNRESLRFQAGLFDATDANLLSGLFQSKKLDINKDILRSDFDALLNPSTPSHSFSIQHFGCTIDYSVDGFLENNVDAISPDLIHLFRYNCTNAFVNELFEESFPHWIIDTHPRDDQTVVKAQLAMWPQRRVGVSLFVPISSTQVDETEKNANDPRKNTNLRTILEQLTDGIDDLQNCLEKVTVSEIIHIAPNAEKKPNVFDSKYVEQQLAIYHVAELTKYSAHFNLSYSYSKKDFFIHYQPLIASYLTSVDSPDENNDDAIHQYIIHWIKRMKWTDKHIRFGNLDVWLSFDVWRLIENQLRGMEKESRQKEKERVAAVEAEKEKVRQLSAEVEANDNSVDVISFMDDRFSNRRTLLEDDCRSYISNDDDRTEIDTQFNNSGRRGEWDEDNRALGEGFGPNLDMSKMMEDYRVKPEEQVEEVRITRIRYWWSKFVYFSTFWIPSWTLKHLGKMNREDVQMAWREKVTLCLLIFIFSACIIFFITGLGELICPGTKEIYSTEDLLNHQEMTNYWVSVRGKVYDLTKFVSVDHGTPVYIASKYNMDSLAGRDVSYTFPPPLYMACSGLVSDTTLAIIPNDTVIVGPFIHHSGVQQPERSLAGLRDPQWLNKNFGPTMKPYTKGDIVIPMKQIEEDYSSWGRLIASIDEKVYDITDYMNTAKRFPVGLVGVPDYHYLTTEVENIFIKNGGKDATEEWNTYSSTLDDDTREKLKSCLDNVFYVGRVDFRESVRCTFVNYLLLSFAVVTSFIILVKFLAALQFGSMPEPEDHDKFVICQVPCYTEDEESLRKTIESLTAMTYDDKHKLLFLIADGMIIGSGNDRPTPLILLNILGHDEKDEPEALMFKSIGEGSKQLNYGKVYSGVYQYEGHIVPYIVVVKVGKPTERAKPGNRGKRDSQIICMNFLNKVHFDSEMTPLELEIYYNIKHVIGIDPSLYEYVLMVDSDTEVYPDALNRLVSCMLHDSRIIGLCGETELGNENRSWATMIQVYEYYISHHLVKSFESLFGSVTCLPGCFCMYRIRTAGNRQPLIVSPTVINDYSDNDVDTLHKKNLLHLGEDRYLTTLMMKTFPQYKMMFTPHAKCRTVAPDEWRVLLSQRRRWINSTIHNLLELILLQQLCGFCCFSMRFVVMTDLIGTITLPSSVIYLGYLIYTVASGSGPIPTIALGMLAGAYGLQSLIFLLRGQWQHIGWMIIYIFAIPIFSFFIPVYAFWHFDDFSWGNTRVVVGGEKKQIILVDDEKFDEKMIPLKKWAQHEQELWETKTLRSDFTKSVSVTESVYLNNHHMESMTDSRTIRGRPLLNHHMAHTFANSYAKYPPSSPLVSNIIENDTAGHFSVDISSMLRYKHMEGRIDRIEDTVVPFPEDKEIEQEIHRMMMNANLMTLTKKQVRDQLSALFHVDLTIKKSFINGVIQSILENDNNNNSAHI
ncbi:chitin synthase-domain-containing protein [Pilobolus umbonatus]|nr:chitin synthase-domain-containing protein [Pilobolus umbonatus]